MVFPLVPVMAIEVSFFTGYPKNAADKSASAFLELFTRITVTSFGRSFMSSSITKALAPAFTTLSISLCESNLEPFMHTNKELLQSFLES